MQNRVAGIEVLYYEEGPGIGVSLIRSEYRELRELGPHCQTRLPWLGNRLRS